MKKANNLKKKTANVNFLETVIDLVAAFFIVSIFNLLILRIFDLSPTVLLERGIATSALEEKSQIIEDLGIIYIILIVSYFTFGRKYFSLGKRILEK